MQILRPITVLVLLMPILAYGQDANNNPPPPPCPQGDIGCVLSGLPWKAPPVVSGGSGIIENRIQEKVLDTKTNVEQFRQIQSPEFRNGLQDSLRASPSLQQLK